MRILAFDSTAPLLTVGLADGDRALGRWDQTATRARGNLLAGLIDTALSACGWTRADIDGLGLVLGPGSLTAMRIGWATATGWAQATGIPVTGWTTVSVQRRALQDRNDNASKPDHTLCLVHHRGDQFYCFDLAAADGVRPTTVTLGQWRPQGEGHYLICGPGVLGYRARWAQSLGATCTIVDDENAIVGGDRLALWAAESFSAGQTLRLESSPLDYGLPPDFRKRVRL